MLGFKLKSLDYECPRVTFGPEALLLSSAAFSYTFSLNFSSNEALKGLNNKVTLNRTFLYLIFKTFKYV